MSDATTGDSAGRVSGSAAEVYERFFVPALFDQWPEHVLDAAGVRPGDRVLDVGCGTGVLTRAAARRVGPRGQVTGLDPNDGMLAVARRSADPIRWQVGVAEALPFMDAAFDRVVSQFALMFVADLPLAVSEFARVLRPAGTAGIAVWAPIEAAPGYAAMAGLLDELFGPRAAASLGAPFALGDERAMKEILGRAFRDVRVEQVEGTARFESIDAWTFTEIRGWTLADAIDDEQFGRLQAEARERLARFADADGRVAFPTVALISTARRQAAAPGAMSSGLAE